MTCQMGAALVSDALQLIPGMPWQARFGLLAIPYAAYAMFAGTRWVLVREIVPEGSYILARSLMNLAEGGMQVVGYGVGGLALLWLSPRGLFAAAALADLVSLVSVRFGLRDRPARTARDRDAADPAAGGSSGKTAGRGGVVRRTMAVNRRLLCSPVTRPLYLALWVPNGLVVGCESLFVPYGNAASGRQGGATGSLSRCGSCWRCRTCCSSSPRRLRSRFRSASSPRQATRRRCRCRTALSGTPTTRSRARSWACT